MLPSSLSLSRGLLVRLHPTAHPTPRTRRAYVTRPMAAAGGLNPGTVQLTNTMEAYTVSPEHRVFAPAAARNKQHILDQLLRFLQPATATATASATSAQQPPPLVILELASGTGEHTAHFAAALPGATLQPSDLTDELFASIAAHSAGLPNVRPPVQLDASQPQLWDAAMAGQQADAIICINMTHISPYSATLGLLDGAAQHLRRGTGLLFIYGPFTVDGGRHTTESNAAFDASLRQRNAEWGYRDVDEIKAQAAARGLRSLEVVDMPANNFMLIFTRES